MNAQHRTSGAALRLQTYRDCPEGLLLRTIGDSVFHSVLNIPEPDHELACSWVEKLNQYPGFNEAGCIEAVTGAMKGWSQFDDVHAAVDAWLTAQGMSGVLSTSDASILGCFGAPFHADFSYFADYSFAVLWLNQDSNLDLYFPNIDKRVPLQLGTVVLFDGSQPHGVVDRGSEIYDGSNYFERSDPTQLFVSWDVSLEHATVATRLGITTHAVQTEHPEVGVTRQGALVTVDSKTGAWQ